MCDEIGMQMNGQRSLGRRKFNTEEQARLTLLEQLSSSKNGNDEMEIPAGLVPTSAVHVQAT